MVDFSSYELNLTRFQAIHDMNLQEARHWNEEAQRISRGTLFSFFEKKFKYYFQLINQVVYIEQEMEETMLVIKNLEKELAQEEEIRRYKAEYDQLAAEINEQKTREESLKYLNNIILILNL